MEQASPALLIPQGWRAIAPSGWGFSLAPVLVLPPHLLGGHWVRLGLLSLFLWVYQMAQEQLLAWQLWPPSAFPALVCPLGSGGRTVAGTRWRHGRSRSYRKDNG